LDSPQFLRNCRVPWDSAWNFLIVVNAPTVIDLSHVEIDSQRDWDDGAEEKYESEEENVRRLLYARPGHNTKTKEEHEDKEEFGESIQFYVQLTHLGIG
jgi:hypothetical protein